MRNILSDDQCSPGNLDLSILFGDDKHLPECLQSESIIEIKYSPNKPGSFDSNTFLIESHRT